MHGAPSAGDEAETGRQLPGALRATGPGRLQIRDGGGCLSLFGLPFFAAGIFMGLAAVGIVPIENGAAAGRTVWVVVSLMAIAFTCVGATLVFGRSWTTIDANERVVITQQGLLVPMRSGSRRIDEFSLVSLGFTAGDSDSADRFPVRLRSRFASDLELFSSTSYAESRGVAVAVARHLHMDVEDATTDHPQRFAADDAGTPLAQRLQASRRALKHVERPAGARSEVARDGAGMSIGIPRPRMRAVTLVFALIPAGLCLAIAGPLRQFFRDSRTPDPIAWIFLGFLGLLFGVAPLASALTAWLRAKHSRTILHVSTGGILVRERRILRTRDVTFIRATDIVDIDASTGSSMVASTRTRAEHDVRNAGKTWEQSDAAATRADWAIGVIRRFATGQGIIVKSTEGLHTFGQGLPDDEIHYLHSVIQHALVGE